MSNLLLQEWVLHQKCWSPVIVAWGSSVSPSSLTKWWKAMRIMSLSIMKLCWKWAKCVQRCCRRSSQSSSAAWTSTTTRHDVINTVTANQNLTQENLQLWSCFLFLYTFECNYRTSVSITHFFFWYLNVKILLFAVITKIILFDGAITTNLKH